MSCIPDFMIIPVITAFVVGLTLSLLSFFVVLKRWAFLSVGVSHAAFGGVALGIFLGIRPDITAVLFGILAAFIIAYARRKGGIHEDTTIGVSFSFFMAVGVILFSLSKTYMINAFSYLFGSLLSVDVYDLLLCLFASFFTLLFLFFKRKELLLLMMDEEVAYVNGVNVAFLYYSLVFLITFSIVVAIKLVGVILVSAMVVVPSSVALKFFSKFLQIMLFSVFLGLLVVFLGIAFSFYWNLPPGATIAFFSGILFFVSLLRRY